eukprot:gnl/Chilomastix_caulleri/710.p1 GENE.gnl/Chilomastix_caulleri/710~~gnl/Chilomastix_caulleri/710.p1  ORF type:complete len:152 (+),score=41.67 gnl/Chilomastix_caulleri/710:458-913(+)
MWEVYDINCNYSNAGFVLAIISAIACFIQVLAVPWFTRLPMYLNPFPLFADVEGGALGVQPDPASSVDSSIPVADVTMGMNRDIQAQNGDVMSIKQLTQVLSGISEQMKVLYQANQVNQPNMTNQHIQQPAQHPQLIAYPNLNTNTVAPLV